jgi:hypothetical protein
MKRYVNSKLGVLYIAMQLDQKLQAEGVKNVLVNAVHPGECLIYSPRNATYS